MRIGETYLPNEPERQPSATPSDNNFIHDGGHIFHGRHRRLDRPQRLQHASPTTRSATSTTPASPSAGAGATPPAPAHHNIDRVQPHPPPRPGRAERHGRHLHPGHLAGHRRCATTSSTTSTPTATAAGASTPTRAAPASCWRTTSSTTPRPAASTSTTASENIVRNNIFAFAWEGQHHQLRASEEHLSFTFERNIVLTNNGQLLGGNSGHDQLHPRATTSTGTPPASDLDFDGHGLRGVAGRRARTRAPSSPTRCSWTRRGYDFRLKPDSAGAKIGFKPFDNSQAGLYGDPEWVALPKAIVRRPIRARRRPAAAGDGRLRGPPGRRPAGAGERLRRGQRRLASASPTTTAASGKQSLKFTDAPGLSHDWQPHLSTSRATARARWRFSFKVRMEPGAILWHEWRDSSSPYKVGPSLRIAANGDVIVARQDAGEAPASAVGDARRSRARWASRRGRGR